MSLRLALGLATRKPTGRVAGRISMALGFDIECPASQRVVLSQVPLQMRDRFFGIGAGGDDVAATLFTASAQEEGLANPGRRLRVDRFLFRAVEGRGGEAPRPLVIVDRECSLRGDD